MSFTAADVIQALGGVTATAKRFNISVPSVSEWKQSGRIPEDRLIRIASELERRGIATRRQLFPDDWHLIWPELAEASDPRVLLEVPLTQQPLFVFAQEVLLGAWKDEELGDQALKAMRAQRNLILKAGASK